MEILGALQLEDTVPLCVEEPSPANVTHNVHCNINDYLIIVLLWSPKPHVTNHTLTIAPHFSPLSITRIPFVFALEREIRYSLHLSGCNRCSCSDVPIVINHTGEQM
jgi:hypothetical protein